MNIDASRRKSNPLHPLLQQRPRSPPNHRTPNPLRHPNHAPVPPIYYYHRRHHFRDYSSTTLPKTPPQVIRPRPQTHHPTARPSSRRNNPLQTPPHLHPHRHRPPPLSRPRVLRPENAIKRRVTTIPSVLSARVLSLPPCELCTHGHSSRWSREMCHGRSGRVLGAGSRGR